MIDEGSEFVTGKDMPLSVAVEKGKALVGKRPAELNPSEHKVSERIIKSIYVKPLKIDEVKPLRNVTLRTDIELDSQEIPDDLQIIQKGQDWLKKVKGHTTGVVITKPAKAPNIIDRIINKIDKAIAKRLYKGLDGK